ncbi:hypothetical protein LaPh949_gp023 [Lactococcus phage 949]|uniref:Uncharacterized protein n=1 Tax=Lactococcus phage 949 TaxID=881953 RepID=E0YIR0_9CAUD|nr:hypothetical protein LaPh949_gp023 [Lactococcus phage 949]ADM73581.1 hypothetical protein [Lactococcus phage 949]
MNNLQSLMKNLKLSSTLNNFKLYTLTELKKLPKIIKKVMKR